MPDRYRRPPQLRKHGFRPQQHSAKRRGSRDNSSPAHVVTTFNAKHASHSPGRIRASAAPRPFEAAVFEADCTDYNRRPIRSGRSIKRSGRTGKPGARRYNLLHDGNKALLVCLAQAAHRLKMGQPGRFLHPAQQRGTGTGQAAGLRPPIVSRDRAIDKATGLQSFKRPSCRRAIECDVSGQRRLIGGSALGQRGEQAVLQRRDLEGRAFLLEQGDVDLVHPPDQITWSILERPRAFGLRASSGHQVFPRCERRRAALHEFEAVYATDIGVGKYEVYFAIGRLL